VEDLKKAWLNLKEASDRMVQGPTPSWPWAENQETFLAQLRRRDQVQGLGGAFNDIWKRHAPAISQVVNDHPEIFPEFHAKVKGDPPDPTSYQQAGLIMPRLIQGGITSSTEAL
jgi:hypothetical protein